MLTIWQEVTNVIVFDSNTGSYFEANILEGWDQVHLDICWYLFYNYIFDDWL